MANIEKGFVIGYAKKLTRATGVSATGGGDPLQTWLKKFAARWGKQGAIDMAARVPMKFAYLLTQHWDCSIFICLGGELIMYSRYSKVNKLPPQIITALNANGITKQTPAVWYKNPLSDEKEQGPASSFILGLPSDQVQPGLASATPRDLGTSPPQASAFESMSRIIVDELTGS